MQSNFFTESNDEFDTNPNLRPSKLKDFIGQQKSIINLQTFINASIKRGNALDHILISGPPGLGKTTLAQIIATEMGQEITSTSAPVLEKSGDLAAILTSLPPYSVLFIDEIHRLRPVLEEILYSAMEDFKIDIVLGTGAGAKTVKLNLNPFTLIGATTRPGMLSSPLQTRFGIDLFLDFYDPLDLSVILKKKAGILGISIAEKASLEIAKRSRGTPRILQKLLKRVWDFSIVANENSISENTVVTSMKSMEIEENGLTKNDLRLLNLMHNNYKGGPVGLSTLSVALGDSEDAIEDIYEPFLIRQGFIQKTPRGRILTSKAYHYLGVKPLHKLNDEENNLFKDFI